MSLSPAAFAQRLNGAVTERQVRNFCKAGMAGAGRIGSRWLIDPGPASEWVAHNAPRVGSRMPMPGLVLQQPVEPGNSTTAPTYGARDPATATPGAPTPASPASVKALVVLMTSVADHLAAGDQYEKIFDTLADLGAAASGTEQQIVDAALQALVEAGIVCEAVDPANGIGIASGFVDRDAARAFLQAADPRMPRRERLAQAIQAGIWLQAF